MNITEGPWEYGKRADGSFWISIGNLTGPGRHSQFDWYGFEEDLKLTCAARELYGALKFIMAFYEPDANKYLDTEAWKVAEATAKAALRKVTE